MPTALLLFWISPRSWPITMGQWLSIFVMHPYFQPSDLNTVS